LAESSVKSVKYLLLKCDSYIDFEKRLYEMQNIPSSGEILSPAEFFFKSRFRSDLPTLDPFFYPVQISEEGRKRFKIGDKVRIQNAVSRHWDDSGTVGEIRDSGRSYYIDRCRDIILCNNIFLKLIALPPIALNRAGEEEESRLASDSLLRENAVEKTHISPGSLPLHRPAVAVPAAREPKRESTWVRKQTIRFSP
jgi:hypothetical protein